MSYKVDPRRDELYFIASTPEPDFKIESWSAQGDLAQLRAAFVGFHPDARIILDACPRSANGRSSNATLAAMERGRHRVVGDACHPMLPYMAQGAASSMEDAVVLARCLSRAGLDSFSDAFCAFERNRKERTSRIQLGARKNVWMRTAPGYSWLMNTTPGRYRWYDMRTGSPIARNTLRYAPYSMNGAYLSTTTGVPTFTRW